MVIIPTLRIVEDIRAYEVECTLVAYDMVIETVLPQLTIKGHPALLSDTMDISHCGHALEAFYQLGQREDGLVIICLS